MACGVMAGKPRVMPIRHIQHAFTLLPTESHGMWMLQPYICDPAELQRMLSRIERSTRFQSEAMMSNTKPASEANDAPSRGDADFPGNASKHDAQTDALVAELRDMQQKVAKILGCDVPSAAKHAAKADKVA
ncbi:MAG: hypothetical protein AAFV45_13155 [Pseudomonadota bacterium]